jgi:PAS domain S-box-containing protein
VTSASPITVLIVDDDPQNREQLKSYLERQQMRVLVAPQVREALAFPALATVKVVLMDVHALNSADGGVAVSDLARYCPNAAIIIMTGAEDLENAVAVFGNLAFSFLHKPVSSLREASLIVERAAREQLPTATAGQKISPAQTESPADQYQKVLTHLFYVSPQFGRLDSAENLLDFICRAIVESSAFARAAIVVGDEHFRIQQVGIFQADGVPDALRETLRRLAGQPLRPFEFERSEERISGAVLARVRPERAADILIVPLLQNGGGVRGFLTLESLPAQPPRAELVNLIEVLLSHATLHLEAQELRQELKRRAAELELRIDDRTHELRLSEERFSHLTNTSTDVIYVTDESGRIVFLNEAFVRVLGYVRENYIGRTLSKLLEEIATDNPINQRTLHDLAATTEDRVSLQIEVLTRQGDKRTLEIRRTWIKQGGTLKGSQGIVRDVTEHRTLLQQLVACERLAATGRLAAGIAHEINNPLQAMSSQLSTLRKKLLSGEDTSSNLDLLQEGVERIRQTVRSLLDLYRGPAPAHVPVNLNEVVEKIAGIVRRELADHNVQLTLSLAAELPSVTGSPPELQQVLLNLVLNAVEAMPQGGDLSVATRATPQSVELVVKDSGIGIAPEHLPQIFEPFFTFKPSGTGTGLGLYLSKNIMDLHQGRIHVESEKDKGSTFTLSFPRR